MGLYNRKAILNFKKEQKGSFTLETSLVFPVLFILTISLVLFSITIYEKVVVYQKAYVVAERIAHTWDNSYKDFETGKFSKEEYTSKKGNDGLYWRTNRIGMGFVEDVFGPQDSVEEKKRLRAIEEAEKLISGSGTSIHLSDTFGFFQTVEVTMEVSLKVPQFVELLTSENFKVTASASIKDPVETIRMTEFAVYLKDKIVGYIPD